MKTNVSDGEFFIIQRMVDGDENAFKYFFDTYYDDLCNFVNGYLHDETLSEDIVQSIFIYLWENRDSLPSNCTIKSYLYSATKNKSLNHLRNVKNKHRIEGALFAQADCFSDEKADKYLEFEELKSILSKATDLLPSQCKTIYQLSRDDGLTHKEIAERLGITIKTVENQMTIAIHKIKDYLQPYQDQIFLLFFAVNIF